jgi:hypothetical protein
MGLHEYDSRPTHALNRSGNYAGDGVVVHNNRPVAVNLQQSNAAPAFQQLNRQIPRARHRRVNAIGCRARKIGARPHLHHGQRLAENGRAHLRARTRAVRS